MLTSPAYASCRPKPPAAATREPTAAESWGWTAASQTKARRHGRRRRRRGRRRGRRRRRRRRWRWRRRRRQGWWRRRGRRARALPPLAQYRWRLVSRSSPPPARGCARGVRARAYSLTLKLCVKRASADTSFPRCSSFFNTFTQQLCKEICDSIRLTSLNSGLSHRNRIWTVEIFSGNSCALARLAASGGRPAALLAVLAEEEGQPRRAGGLAFGHTARDPL